MGMRGSEICEARRMCVMWCDVECFVEIEIEESGFGWLVS